MPAKPYQELLENRQQKKLYHELGLDPSNVSDGTENFAYFIRFSKKINQFTFPI